MLFLKFVEPSNLTKCKYNVLYGIMRPYTDGPLDHYRIGIPRELSEISPQPWLSEGYLPCDPCHHRGPIF